MDDDAKEIQSPTDDEPNQDLPPQIIEDNNNNIDVDLQKPIIEDDDDQGEGEEERQQKTIPDNFEKISQEIDRFVLKLKTAKKDKSPAPELSESFKQFAHHVEAKFSIYDSSSDRRWNQLSEVESSSFLDTVERVSRLAISLSHFHSESTYAPAINLISRILQHAMSYLEDEFIFLLEESKNIEPETKINPTNEEEQQQVIDQGSESDNQQATPSSAAEIIMAEGDQFQGYSDEIVLKLNKISKAMSVGGYSPECVQGFIITRKAMLEDTLQKVGFEKFSIDEVQKMQWETLERGIVSWINAFKHCMKVQLPGERKLADSVFTDVSDAEEVFTSLSRGIVLQLLNFAEATTMMKRSSDKLFKFLDIHEAIQFGITTINELYREECGKELRSEAAFINFRFGEAVVSIFYELEKSIEADTSKNPVPGGAVHPLTRYLMNYLKYAGVYAETLERVFQEHHQKIGRTNNKSTSNPTKHKKSHKKDKQKQEQPPPPPLPVSTPSSSSAAATVSNLPPLATQMNKIMDLLDINLDAKSKLYKDVSLSLIFLMNNGRYVLQKIKGSTEIHKLMGDTWSRKKSSELRQYHKNYQRETWGKLLNCLNHEGLNVNGKVMKPVVKERLKSFNSMFDDIHKNQREWVLSDEQLRSELRVSISSVVIPAYRSFLARFASVLSSGRQTQKYVKFQTEDIETRIEGLFDGNASASGGGSGWKK
ncbi:exocyst complex component EXO70B1-like [Impatiens glandulifera]|uniref:exocyst complex component EXO70B1-like n=1 Tax=Impatiens glandulifera TaxID=253017 RepID=UPI001FB1265F|nr:exocyst complex component EXO70B1-like [Impatiens glandulifera]